HRVLEIRPRVLARGGRGGVRDLFHRGRRCRSGGGTRAGDRDLPAPEEREIAGSQHPQRVKKDPRSKHQAPENAQNSNFKFVGLVWKSPGVWSLGVGVFCAARRVFVRPMILPAAQIWLIPALPLVAAGIISLTPRAGRRLAAGAAI